MRCIRLELVSSADRGRPLEVTLRRRELGLGKPVGHEPVELTADHVERLVRTLGVRARADVGVVHDAVSVRQRRQSGDDKRRSLALLESRLDCAKIEANVCDVFVCRQLQRGRRTVQRVACAA